MTPQKVHVVSRKQTTISSGKKGRMIAVVTEWSNGARTSHTRHVPHKMNGKVVDDKLLSMYLDGSIKP